MPDSGYNIIADFYDKVIGKSNDSTNYIKEKIIKYNKGGLNVLELGCGTANNLLKLPRSFKITGIDISTKMLKIAKKKIPEGNFYLQDIVNFDLKKKFDVILCLYDTINHLSNFSHWKKVFANTSQHLSKNGLFIFDINTLNKLEFISSISPLVQKFNKDYLIINVQKQSKHSYNWNLKIFHQTGKNNFYLYETNILEVSFEIAKIRNELLKLFVIKRMEDENKKAPTINSLRIYFVCQKI